MVLESCQPVFAERGFDAVSMADLAAAAHVDRAILYRLFGNQLGLYRACLEDAAARARHLIEARAQTGGPVTGQLLRRLLDNARRGPGSLAIVTRLPADPQAAALVQAIQDDLAERFRSLIMMAVPPDLGTDELRWTADLVYGALVQALTRHIEEDPVETDARFIRFIQETVGLLARQMPELGKQLDQR
ncbi:MAG: hypothetical protein JJLCMIEE_02533 [Acidimicrobiales bacterium]|nr:hypothetical protein [Acidimicrobiales bacterium]